jgi:hypothetical protein
MAAILSCLPVTAQDESVVWNIETCRITTSSDGTFLGCENQGECASQTTGSKVNCTTYTYNQIPTMAECISVCCWGLSPVPSNLTGPLIQECYDQAQYRFKIYVIKVVFIVLGVAIVVAIIIGCCVCGYVKNPYTGRRAWVGCCCCKRVPNFEADRYAIHTQNALNAEDAANRNYNQEKGEQGRSSVNNSKVR